MTIQVVVWFVQATFDGSMHTVDGSMPVVSINVVWKTSTNIFFTAAYTKEMK